VCSGLPAFRALVNLQWPVLSSNDSLKPDSDLSFAPKDRKENIRRVGEVASLFADASVICLTAFISPYRSDRDRIRKALPSERFFEIHVATPLSVCENRDPKGLYQKARAGEIMDFTGITAPYEPPLSPELVVNAPGMDLDDSVDLLWEMLLKNQIF
jgi:adenylyl-sulfate kinase